MPITREFLLTPFEGPWYPGFLAGADACAGRSSGGPGALAGILETHLGLARGSKDPARRRLEAIEVLRSALARDPGLFYAASFGLDPEGTAGRLLFWQDTLLWAGWSGKTADLPPRLRTAMEALGGAPATPPTLAERIAQILEALDAGGPKVFDAIHLVDAREDHPPLLRRLLEALESRGAAIRPRTVEEARGQTGDLRAAAAQIRGKSGFAPKGDGTLRLLTAGTPLEAAEALAAWLKQHGSQDSAMIIPETYRSELDGAFRRFHLPAPGSAEATAHLPALQVLPLYLTLQWEPMDAEAFLEFLTLAVSPLPSCAARPLARAFSERPGIGNDEWEKAMAKAREGVEQRAAEKGRDPEGDWKRVLAWLPLPPTLLAAGRKMRLTRLAESCAGIQMWAHRRLEGMKNDPPEKRDAVLEASFKTAADQAERLLRLAEWSGRLEFSAIEIRRLLTLVSEEVRTADRAMEAGAPAVVRDPAALLAPVETVVWWGFTGSSAATIPAPPFTALEVRTLAKKGICLPDPARRAQAIARGWARPLLAASRQVLLVSWDQRLGEEEVPHPLWHQLTASLKPAESARLTVSVHDLLHRPPAGFDTDHAMVPGRTLPRARRRWSLPGLPTVLNEPESATSLVTLASCPLKHVLERRAKLEAGKAVELIALPLLLGHLSHAILEAVFAPGQKVPADAALRKQVDALLEERVPQEAVLLLQPGQEVRHARFRRAVHRSALELARLLRTEKLIVEASEREVKDNTEIAPIRGCIDMLLKDHKGRPCILDLKYSESGESKYIAQLKEEPVQLAIYARLVDLDAPVAYFSLGDAQFISAKGNPFPGAWGIKSLTARETWGRLCATVGAILDDQFKNQLVLATGVADAAGVEKGVPKVEGGLQSMKPPCDWCSFGALCGWQWSQAEEDDENRV